MVESDSGLPDVEQEPTPQDISLDSNSPTTLIIKDTAEDQNNINIFDQQQQIAPGFDDIGDFRWQNRLVIVFAPSEDSSLLKQQRANIDCNQQGYKDRTLRVIEVVDDEVFLDGQIVDSPPANDLRIQFGAFQQEFQAILIGLDGGVKLAMEGVLTSDLLFSEIDVMPMRRQEILNQGFAVPSIDC
eukprot:TRINITY_DN647_c0_g2_i7.p3 TRINITY_DN647_c0_g2~~TRINITY_DN647_c0_g2_i7.p3  ORF type:complete len:217 (+),score=27.64 TRINITY_DN647_c0_g2_i7:94-651(+)